MTKSSEKTKTTSKPNLSNKREIKMTDSKSKFLDMVYRLSIEDDEDTRTFGDYEGSDAD